MIRRFCHQLIEWYSKKNYDFFKAALNDPEEAQVRVLKKLTGIGRYEDFRDHFPLTEYSDWKAVVEKQKSESPKDHFVPTSGSTHTLKWIPYTKNFKAELWKASSPWIHDLYLRHPEIKNGTHYWSLSWLPEELRSHQSSNDLDFFIGIERYLLKQTMTLDERSAHLPSLKESMRESLISLIEKDVSLISVWSPTFLLEILELLLTDQTYVLKKVSDQKKMKAISDSKSLSPELMRILFPRLVLISSWATSSSRRYADKVQELFPHAKFEGKGLWATEGVVTIPFQGKFPLAVNSHFYEFEDLDAGHIYPSWELKKGMRVSPLLTTGAGFFRYRLNDILVVDDFIGKTPCLIFKGRKNVVDLVGEKISSELAGKIIEELNAQFSSQALSLLAIQSDKPHYRLLVEAADKMGKADELQEALEQKLQESFHYKLARELNQLGAAQVVVKENAYLDYLNIQERNVAIKGNIKIEPLVLVKE